MQYFCLNSVLFRRKQIFPLTRSRKNLMCTQHVVMETKPVCEFQAYILHETCRTKEHKSMKMAVISKLWNDGISHFPKLDVSYFSEHFAKHKPHDQSLSSLNEWEFYINNSLKCYPLSFRTASNSLITTRKKILYFTSLATFKMEY